MRIIKYLIVFCLLLLSATNLTHLTENFNSSKSDTDLVSVMQHIVNVDHAFITNHHPKTEDTYSIEISEENNDSHDTSLVVESAVLIQNYFYNIYDVVIAATSIKNGVFKTLLSSKIYLFFCVFRI